MNSYYPEVIRNIREFNAIVDVEYPEFETIFDGVTRVTNDAYVSTMSKDRVKQWETILGIIPIEGSSLSDRQETVIARIRGQGKLNTALINSIVNVFTGGTADSWVEDSVLYVEITPPPNNKQYQFANVEQELRKKLPAHLGFNVRRNYFTWNEVNETFDNWNNVNETLSTWNDVYLYVLSNR